jgi:transposase
MVIKQRDSLVRARVALIGSMRSTLKSLGYKVSNPSSERFHKLVLQEVPVDIQPILAPTVAALTEISLQIKELDATIKQLSAERYPETLFLQQISGVGPITSLAFVLKIESPDRFARTRDVGAYLGLCPRRDQSGDSDKQLPITKAGDRYLRRLLVSAAQYILGPFGRESALRSFGLQLASAGNSRAKKRAVIAVARKLSVLMLSLWKAQALYEPFPEAA